MFIEDTQRWLIFSIKFFSVLGDVSEARENQLPNVKTKEFYVFYLIKKERRFQWIFSTIFSLKHKHKSIKIQIKNTMYKNVNKNNVTLNKGWTMTMSGFRKILYIYIKKKTKKNDFKKIKFNK